MMKTPWLVTEMVDLAAEEDAAEDATEDDKMEDEDGGLFVGEVAEDAGRSGRRNGKIRRTFERRG